MCVDAEPAALKVMPMIMVTIIITITDRTCISATGRPGWPYRV